MDIRYTRHALDRMVEMGVGRDVVEDILRRPSLTRPSARGDRDNGVRMAVSDSHPQYAVVYHPNDLTHGPYVVVTVVFRTYDQYVREGDTYRKD